MCESESFFEGGFRGSGITVRSFLKVKPMKLLTILKRPATKIYFPKDVQEISDELKRQGFVASESDIAWAYGEWSEDRWCASWMSLGVISVAAAAAGVREYLIEPE